MTRFMEQGESRFLGMVGMVLVEFGFWSLEKQFHLSGRLGLKPPLELWYA
jgi:hypothetical protein